MYPTLPFGPLALPTGPVLAILAVVLTLDVAGRFGRRMGVHPDDIWNVGLIALAAGLIVARLWNVFQFWYIYQSEPILIFSIRPSGFEFWPGLIAALIAGYAYLWRRALDPVRVAAALAAGMVAGSIILSISGYATGALLGTVSDAPWALPYFGESRHPVGIYQAVALLLLSILLRIGGDVQRPARLFLQALLGYSLVRLFTDGFLAESAVVGGLRVSQLVALGVALVAALLLARSGIASASHAATNPGSDAPTRTQEEAGVDSNGPSEPETSSS